MARTGSRIALGQRDAFGKALQLLSWIVDAPSDGEPKEWGVRQLAQALHLPPATVHRVLATLMKHGLIQHNPASGQYQVGAEFYRLALKLQASFAIRNAGIPVMQDLVAQCNEAAFLGYYDSFRMEMMFVAMIDSSHPLRYVVPLNMWIPVHAGASGLAIMAFLPQEERHGIIKRTRLAPITKRTITDPVVLEEELAKVRMRGYALSFGQRTEGAVAIGAPIWGPSGRILGELNLSIPESRFDAKMEPTFARLVIQHAKRIMENLGAQAPQHDKFKDPSRR